ncbi:MAG TPA: ABC transporter permease, partial [Longimicrobiales bacterium]|nr:ABC transporter permease [Longimicrobiales bacterium]
ILLRPLPFAEPDRLVRVREVSTAGWEMQGAWRNYLDYRERTRTLSSLVAYGPGGSSTVLGAGEPLRVGVAPVSIGFFRTLGVQPVHGRDFMGEDHHQGAQPVIVISEGFWRGQLGGRPLQEIGLSVAGFDTRAVGVMPAGFDFPGEVDIWYPAELGTQSESRTSHNWGLLGRLRPGATLDAADRELDAITADFAAEAPGVENEPWFRDYFPIEVRVQTLHEATVGPTRRSLLILLGASMLVLLVACTNLASTTLARGTARTREYAVRQALGVGRSGLVRQLFVEGLVLSLGGALLGVALAALIGRLLPVLAPAGIPRVESVTLDGPVVAFAVGVAVLTSVLFGLLPALRLTDRGLANPRRGGARAGTGRVGQRVWRALVAAEMALALVLLVGSGLLLRSFARVLDVDPGFRTEGLLTATVNPPASKYGDMEARRLYYQTLEAGISALPGTEAVGLVGQPPMTWVANGLVDVRGGPNAGVTGDYQLVTDGYFAAMGIPLLRGRLFDGRDLPDGEHAVVVNRAFAELAWPGEDPIGKQMTAGGMDSFWNQERWATVVGVVADVRQRSLERAPEPTYYFPLRQRPSRSWSMTAVIRPAAGGAGALTRPVRETVRRVDADVPVTFATIEERVSTTLAARRFTMMVLGVFAAAALALAFIGVYGVVSYAVERRTREVGIRLALGAEASSVRALVQRDYLTAGAVGALAGIGLSLALARVLESMLYEVAPTDRLTFGAVLAVLGTAVWLASFIPSLRSTRVDPLVSMRAE